MAPTDAFAADEPEGSPSSSGYISGKDFKLLGLVLVILFIILIPIFQYMKRQGEKAGCSNNMRAIAQAVLLYSEQNDGSLPVAFYPDENGSPVLINGTPITWATLVQEGMNARASFKCPSAEKAEFTRVTPIKGDKPIELTYGMFAGASGRTLRQFDNPSATVLIAESSNHGARRTYNPLPFKDADGNEIANDGFLIGFSASNAQGQTLKEALDEIAADTQKNEGDPTKKNLTMPKWVTRLAFPDTANEDFRKEGLCRHDPGIHVIYLDGSLGLLKPNAARVDFESVGATRSRWAVP